MKLRVTSAGHYLHTVREGEPLPDLTPALKRVCRERPRRVDRFIELALLGSGQCVRGRELKPGCGIYLGSGFGPMASNLAVQEQMLRDRELPKPFDFMNILGASAGFHVAKNLGLKGQNLFISRRGASLEAALTLAQADLMLGVVSQALVGVVEEATLPLAQHRQRQGVPADTPVAEGSHWL
ncbi:MAG TPA: beta-ketoacyl synthase N-terminal-like domain-containing protein, partial [Gammaproteobacteria bacterium]|nr:beta-ketoacyl synthase N-terminal-like domain-containing protein [Gammaproteobacteria bacterium]